jgi:hypothetical protein
MPLELQVASLLMRLLDDDFPSARHQPSGRCGSCRAILLWNIDWPWTLHSTDLTFWIHHHHGVSAWRTMARDTCFESFDHVANVIFLLIYCVLTRSKARSCMIPRTGMRDWILRKERFFYGFLLRLDETFSSLAVRIGSHERH